MLPPLGYMTSLPGVISYPIPLYQNLPIEAQYYKPGRFVISGITLGQTTIVTTALNHNYVIGQQVRLLVPSAYGSTQLNEMQGFVISLPSVNQVEINIDSSLNVDQFVSSSVPNQPQILAIGDVNTGHTNCHGRVCQKTYIPGSFRNISPY